MQTFCGISCVLVIVLVYYIKTGAFYLRSYPRVYGRLSELVPKEVLNEGVKRWLFLIHQGVYFKDMSSAQLPTWRKILDNAIYAHQGAIFHVFLPKRYAGNAKFIEKQHFMNRSIRRHLNEHKIFFEFFLRLLVDPLGGPKMAKKLEISRFYHILVVFGHFGQFKHEKST